MGGGNPCEPHLTKDLGQVLEMARPTETETETEPQLDLEANPMQRPRRAGTEHRRTARTDHCICRTDTGLQPTPDPTDSSTHQCNRTPRSLKNRSRCILKYKGGWRLVGPTHVVYSPNSRNAPWQRGLWNAQPHMQQNPLLYAINQGGGHPALPVQPSTTLTRVVFMWGHIANI